MNHPHWRRDVVAIAIGGALITAVFLAATLAPWRAFIPVTMQAATPPPPEPTTVGSWAGRDRYDVRGTVAVNAAPEAAGVWLVSYAAQPLRDPRLLLSAAEPSTIGNRLPAGAIDIGLVPGSEGSRRFALPAALDPTQLRSAVLYDEGLERVVAVAALAPPPPAADRR